ncbi:MAG TPA: M20/M25/M40 family metallo-hydrolase [Puia sp.]
MRSFLFGCFVFLFAGSLKAQSDSVFIRKIADEIFHNSTAYSNLYTLTKTIGQRLSGSPATYTSEKWAQEVIMKAGISHVYLQKAMIPHWVRAGRDQAALISGNNRQNLEVIALGNSVSTPVVGITAHMILIHDFDELEKRKNEIKGKIVFYNHPFHVDYVWTFLAYSEAVPYRVFGASRAAKYGAVGTVVRSMSESTDNFPHTGAMIYNDSFPKIPTLAVGLQDADKLAAANLKDKEVSLFISTNAHALPDTIGYNVIGEWKGSEFPDQYITVGGHLDSWDPAEGAHDDGAGCVQSIEVLRALKAMGYQPKHTIRVVLFTDEENGGRGAKAYSAEAKTKNEKHIFALESDGGGFTPRGFSFKGTESQLAGVKRWLPLLVPYGVTEFSAGGAGADVEPLNEATGAMASELIPDSQRYFDIHHSAGDVFEKVNKRELELGAINMAALIYLTDKYGL